MTNEELQIKVDKLERELNELKMLFYKDNYSNLEVFRKQIQFKADIDMANINKITKTAGTAPIVDGNKTINIGDGGGSITISTKNGIITAIT